MMKRNLIISITLISLLIGCKRTAFEIVNEMPVELQSEISDTLKNIAVAFLRSWEPPFYPEKALELFTQSEDFCLIIDGLAIKDYNDWAQGVPNFMSDDNYFFKSYKHEIKEIRTVVLSPTAGVVTIIYVWDSVTTDDVHRNTDGAATLTCRLEENGWKIVHYHGSHDTDRIID